MQLHDYHPMYSTATPAGRNFNAAHTGNIAFADEIGHFEYCAKVRNDALGTCAKPLGDDTNDPDNAGPDPHGDDVFCLPASASTLVKIGGCLEHRRRLRQRVATSSPGPARSATRPPTGC